MRGRVLARTAATIGTVALLGATSPALAAAPSRYTVVIDATAYAQATLTVPRGSVVTWANRDPFPHTVTAAGSFDSGSIASGKSWSYTARKTGRYDYVCTLHPTMRGTLIVE